jgi:hypothetical protein
MQASSNQGKLHFLGGNQISFGKGNEFVEFRKIQKK